MSRCSGDSFSCTGFAFNLPPPVKMDRKTVPYKGLTYADEDGTNWVGYLLTQHDPHPDMLVYNYAAGGARVRAAASSGTVETQVTKSFLEGHAMSPREGGGPTWDAENSLFGE